MRRAHGGALLLIWAIGSAAFGANACGATTAQTCTAIGCDTGEKLQFYLPALTVRELNVEACRNAQCWQAQLLLNPDGQAQFLGSKGAFYAQLWLEPLTSNGSRVTALFGTNDASQIAVGDALRLTFTDAAGTRLFAVSGKVQSFSDSFPNGPDCDPSPCRQATAEIDPP